MAVAFLAVRCPVCEARGVAPVPVVMDIAKGIARARCRVCRRRVWAACDGREVRILMVDRAVERVRESA